jgi:hypothetical protein
MSRRFSRELTPEQERAIGRLGGSDALVRPALAGPDVFVYIDEGDSTLRYQVAPQGNVVGHVRLKRERATRVANPG